MMDGQGVADSGTIDDHKETITALESSAAAAAAVAATPATSSSAETASDHAHGDHAHSDHVHTHAHDEPDPDCGVCQEEAKAKAAGGVASSDHGSHGHSHAHNDHAHEGAEYDPDCAECNEEGHGHVRGTVACGVGSLAVLLGMDAVVSVRSIIVAVCLLTGGQQSNARPFNPRVRPTFLFRSSEVCFVRFVGGKNCSSQKRTGDFKLVWLRKIHPYGPASSVSPPLRSWRCRQRKFFFFADSLSPSIVNVAHAVVSDKFTCFFVYSKQNLNVFVGGGCCLPLCASSCVHGQDHSHSHGHNEVGDGTTTAAKRFGIDNFVYRQRRPFHPERLEGVLKVTAGACVHALISCNVGVCSGCMFTVYIYIYCFFLYICIYM